MTPMTSPRYHRLYQGKDKHNAFAYTKVKTKTNTDDVIMHPGTTIKGNVTGATYAVIVATCPIEPPTPPRASRFAKAAGYTMLYAPTFTGDNDPKDCELGPFQVQPATTP